MANYPFISFNTCEQLLILFLILCTFLFCIVPIDYRALYARKRFCRKRSAKNKKMEVLVF